jgi:ribosomal protein L33
MIIVQLHSQECNGTYSIALLGNGIFFSISRDRKQRIKRLEFNKVLYNTEYCKLKYYYNAIRVVFHQTSALHYKYCTRETAA